MALWKALAVLPLAAALAAGSAKAETPKRTPSPYALTDSELASIPPPSIHRFHNKLVREIQAGAKAGDIERVKAVTLHAPPPQPGDDLYVYRNAVIEAMRIKAAAAKRP